MTSAVTHSPIAAAATSAMNIDSSMLIRRARSAAQTSTTIGQQPITRPTAANGALIHHGACSQDATSTTTARPPTTPRRTRSSRSIRCHSSPALRGWYSVTTLPCSTSSVCCKDAAGLIMPHA